MAGVLDDIRVLDFGRYIAGPCLATHLADLGADVIRIEKLDGSEDRFVTPVAADGSGALFLQVGRNKRGMTLNPTKPAGRDVLRRLVATADVVVANMPPAGLAAMGVDYDSLREVKPDIILATNNVFGSGGPWSERVGFDGLAQAMSGAAAMSGPAGQPTRSSAPFVDFCSATLGAVAVIAAIRHRDQTGEGQHVETALLKTALMMTNSMVIEQALLGPDRESTHNRGQTAAPSDYFRCHERLHRRLGPRCAAVGAVVRPRGAPRPAARRQVRRTTSAAATTATSCAGSWTPGPRRAASTRPSRRWPS